MNSYSTVEGRSWHEPEFMVNQLHIAMTLGVRYCKVSIIHLCGLRAVQSYVSNMIGKVVSKWYDTYFPGFWQ